MNGHRASIQSVYFTGVNLLQPLNHRMFLHPDKFTR